MTSLRPAALRPTVLLVSTLSLASCWGDDSPTDTVPPPTVAALAFLTAPTDQVVASAVSLQVRVDGTDGKPMAGTSVAFSVTAGSANPTSATTDASGVASVSWTLGTAAGSQTLTASASGKSATATVTARAAAASVFEKVSGDAQSGAAGDPLKDPLVIAVKDPFANPRSGESLTVAVSGGGGSVGSASATTGSDGRASIVWTLGQALGANTLTVTHALGTLTFTATARPGAPATVAAISGSGQTATAGTALANPLVVEVKDRLGHLVPGAKVAFVPTVGGGKASADTVTTGADGRAQAQWTLGVTAGAQTLEARIQGATTATFGATAVAGPAAKLEAVSGSGQNGTVGQNLAQAVVVKVSDAFGNGVSGASVAFATATAGGQSSPAQATTGANGEASSTWKLGTVAGAQTLTASVSGLTPVTFAAQAAAGASAQVRVASGSAQTATVGQALANPLAAEVVDAFGNPVPGVTVTFTPAAGGGTVTPTSGATGSNGRVSTAWTLGTGSGTQTVAASATGATSATFTATATPGPAASFAKSSGDTQTGQATAPLASPLVVIAKDAFGNGVPGVAVTFSVTAGGGSVNPASATTGNDGRASTTFTLGPTVGSHAAQASAGALGTVSFTANATSGPPTAISKVSGDAQTRTVGDTLSVTVEVTDVSGNKVPNATVAFSAVSGAVASPSQEDGPAAAATASKSTNAQGRATAVWTLGTAAGTQTLTASVTGAGSVTFTATARAGAASALTKVAGDNQSATVSTAVATRPKVKVADAFGNGVSGVSVTFAVASGGGSATGLTQTTGSDGTATVGGWTLGANVGANTLTAAASGLTTVTFTATGTPAASAGYNIEIRVIGGMSAAVQAAFAAAEGRWEQVITGDLDNESLTAAQVDSCGMAPAEALSVDDLVIYARVTAIDGVGNILAQAGPCWLRDGSFLPILGTMEFDEADLASMQSDGTLGDVILHEMGHVIGIGTVWDYHSLLQGAGSADPYFSGAQAKAAYQGLGATLVNGVPVENTGGEGTRDGHWRETVFRTELMTGYVSGPGNPLSVITVRSLADQGYAVNTGAADGYSLPSPALRRAEAQARPTWERLLKPRGAVGPDGAVVRE